MTRSFAILAAIGLSVVMAASGCARQIGGNVYDGRTLGEAVPTEMGSVVAARPVLIDDGDYLDDNALGQAVGGVAGGIAGAQVGKGLGQVAAAAGGAILGATLGAVVEDDLRRQSAMEYVVRMQDGRLVTIVQRGPGLAPGSRVYVQTPYYGRARLIPAA